MRWPLLQGFLLPRMGERKKNGEGEDDVVVLSLLLSILQSVRSRGKEKSIISRGFLIQLARQKEKGSVAS